MSGNFILGENKAGTGGIRVIGPNQTVVNNYMSDLDTNAISLTTGWSDFNTGRTRRATSRVDNVLIAHNTMVNVTDQIVTRDAGFDSPPHRDCPPGEREDGQQHPLEHERNADPGDRRAGLDVGGEPRVRHDGRQDRSGNLNVNPQLVKDAKGIWRPAAGSPAINAGATGPWALPGVDMDGQARTSPFDIGPTRCRCAGDERAAVGVRCRTELAEAPHDDRRHGRRARHHDRGRRLHRHPRSQRRRRHVAGHSPVACIRRVRTESAWRHPDGRCRRRTMRSSSTTSRSTIPGRTTYMCCAAGSRRVPTASTRRRRWGSIRR